MVHRFALIACLLLAGCATQQRPASRDAAGEPGGAPPAAPASSNPVEALGLEVVLNDQTTTGRLMKLRGIIINPHSQVVTGVRVQLVFLAPSDGGMRILEIQQKEMGSTIPPGERTMLSWDVESMYLGSAGGRFVVAAYPARLGDQDLPPPDHWQE